MDKPAHSCCHETPAKKPWYRSLFLVSLIAAFILLGLSFLIEPFHHFRHAFFDYLKMMGLPIFLGFLIGGLMDYYVPREYISKHLAQRRKRTVFYAVGLGFLASACSHGVVTLAMELHKKGASGAAVVSFLLASPWASLPITFILLGFFGAKAFLIIGGALLIALNTGLIFQILEKKGWVEKNKNFFQVPEVFSIRADFVKRFRRYSFTLNQAKQDLRGIFKGMKMLANMVLGWILIGILLASLSAALVPQDIFRNFLGPTFIGLLITLVIAAVLEVCSEGTSPLAFEIFKQTGAFGNAFAFLMGGVVTDYTEIGLVWMNLGKKTALWMLGLTLPQVLLLGWIYNRWF